MPRACPVCGSRRWRKSGGIATCEEGHVLQGFRTEEAVLTEIGQHQLHRRRLRQTNPKDRKRQVGEKDPDVFEGEAKHYLRLELFQLMLRHQLAAVQKAWGVPKEIEVIARDLWILTLELYPTPEPPVPHGEDGEEQNGQAGPGPSTMDMAAQKQPGYPSRSTSQPLPAVSKRGSSRPVISREREEEARRGSPAIEQKKRGRPLGRKDSKPRKSRGSAQKETRDPAVPEPPSTTSGAKKKKRGRPPGQKNGTTKKVRIRRPDGGDYDMDATEDEGEPGEDDTEEFTDDDPGEWTDDEIDNADEKGDGDGDQYAIPGERDYEDEDGGETDKDEFEYGESERDIESDLLERLSAFSDDESITSKHSVESVLIEGIIKVPFSNGNIHLMDKDNKGRFISTSGFPYGVKRSSNLKWSSGSHLKGVNAETVVHILVLSLWMMRIPVMLVDIMRAMDDGTLPYIEFGRSTYVPDPMKPHMSIDLLSGGTWSKRSPSVYFFWERMKLLADDLDHEKGIRIPELNAAPILWRLVTTLGGGPVVYLVAYQILQILDMSLTISRPEHFHNGQPYVNPSAPNSRDTSPGLDASEDANSGPPKAVNTEEEEIVEGITMASKRWRGPKRPHGQSSAIELRLVGAVLIAFKLIYGLDGTPRAPVTRDDPAIGLPVADEWLAEVSKKLKAGWFKRGAVEAVPIDFTRAENVDLDDFLARAEHFLLSSRAYPAHLRNTKNLADLFPLYLQADLTQPHDMTDHAIAAWSEFSKTSDKIKAPPPPDFDIIIPETDSSNLPLGSRIRIYIAGKVVRPTMAAIRLPRALRTVIDATSHIIGIRPIHIVQQLSQMERKLYWAQKPWQSKRVPETARWAKYREDWEFQRQHMRGIVEQTQWDDEDDDSDLQSWHASGSESDSD